jgi:hypothetical protein
VIWNIILSKIIKTENAMIKKLLLRYNYENFFLNGYIEKRNNKNKSAGKSAQEFLAKAADIKKKREKV